MTKLKVTFAAILTLLLLSTQAIAVQAFVLTKNDKTWMKAEKAANGNFKATADDSSTAELVKDGSHVTTSGGDKFKINYKEGKITLTKADSTQYLRIDDDGEKIKIIGAEKSAEQWSIKKKADKDAYKVKRAGKDAGKVKFYPEKSKTKAKDESGTEICMMRSNALSPAPALCLMNDIAQKDRLVIFLLFVAYDLK